MIPVKRFAPFLLLSCLLLAAAPLAAQDARPQFNTIVVKQFSNAGKVNVPQDFIDRYSAGLIGELQTIKIANQVVVEGVPVAAADAAGSITIEGKFTQFDKGGMYAPGQLDVLINIYRNSDGALVKTISTSIPFKSPTKSKDQNPGEYTGGRTALLLQQNLRKITLPTLAPAFPVANHPAASAILAPVAAAPSAPATPAAAVPNATPAAAAPSPAPAAAMHSPAPARAPAAGPAAAADVEISSDPSDAAILFDGKYVDSTPSIIKLAPGTHEITIKKKGFADWRCKLNATGGNIHLNAELERAAPASVTAPAPQ